MRLTGFTILLGIALVAGVAAAASADQGPASVSEFRVVYYADAATVMQIDSGSLQIERDAFRFSSNSGHAAWVVEFAAVESIIVEPFPGPYRTVTSIVIESMENGRRVRRRIAAVDDLSLNERAMLTGMMRLRVEQFKTARASSR